MVKLLLPAAAALLLSIAGAQAKKVKDVPAQQAPAAETTSLPPDPVAVQKWFGDAVDGILTDTDRMLKGPDSKP